MSLSRRCPRDLVVSRARRCGNSRSWLPINGTARTRLTTQRALSPGSGNWNSGAVSNMKWSVSRLPDSGSLMWLRLSSRAAACSGRQPSRATGAMTTTCPTWSTGFSVVQHCDVVTPSGTASMSITAVLVGCPATVAASIGSCSRGNTVPQLAKSMRSPCLTASSLGARSSHIVWSVAQQALVVKREGDL